MFARFLIGGSLVLSAVSAVSGYPQSGAPARPCDRPPPAPTDVVANVETTTLTLTWKGSENVTGYNVEFGNASGSTYLGTVDTSGPDTRFSKTLDPGVYYVRVRARSACGSSAVSPEVRVVVDSEHIGARTTPDVIVARRTAARNTYFPTVERLKNGQLLVVYYDSPDHVSPAGRISMVRSADQGRTWSAPKVVVDGPTDERDPSIMQTSRGTLLVSYFKSDATKAPTSQGVFVVRSNDGGQTWSAPSNVDTRLTGAASSAKIVERATGELLIPLYGLMPGKAEAVATLARSKDQGVTWARDLEVTMAAMPGIDFVEPAVADLGRGRLYAMYRTERGERFAYENYSTDGGATWSTPTKTAFAAQSSDLLVVPGKDTDLIVHTWGDMTGRFGDSRPTVIQTTRFIEFPQRRASDEPHVLHQGHCWSDEGQPSSVLLPNRRLFTVYYDACAGYIGGTFSSLPDSAALEECGAAPPPPQLGLASNVDGTVAIEWKGAGGRTAYVVEAGRASGASDVANVDVGSKTTYSASRVNPGTYYVRVRGRNLCGIGEPSNELVVVVR